MGRTLRSPLPEEDLGGLGNWGQQNAPSFLDKNLGMMLFHAKTFGDLDLVAWGGAKGNFYPCKRSKLGAAKVVGESEVESVVFFHEVETISRTSLEDPGR